MKVVVTGARGLLGTEFVQALEERGDDVVALGRPEMDVTDADAVHRTLADAAPDVVVHCAAWTAVDAAESHPEEAMRVNRDGARHVAAAAEASGARCVHISTDYVFDGTGRRPYRHDDPVGPLSVYGRTKLAGEEAVLDATGGKALVARTGWLYGAGGGNFVDSMIAHGRKGTALRVVDDQVGHPTWTRNVVSTVLQLIDVDARGVWHVADGGHTSWRELALHAFRERGLDATIAPISTEEWGAAAPRPRYSVLDLERTERAVGRPMQPWDSALEEYLRSAP